MASVGLSPAPLPAAGQSEVDAEVTLEDQRSINRFARLNAKEEDLDEMFKKLKRALANVQEANDELALADDDDDDGLGGDLEEGTDRVGRDLSNIHFRIGEAFVAVNKDDAEAMLETKRKELEGEVQELEGRIAPMKEEMSNIKARLYAKFGNNINLDHDEDA